MLWAISCVDKPNSADARTTALQKHRDYLQTKKNILVLAGPTQTDDGMQVIGSLFILNVNSREEAKAFSDGDPFNQAGVFASITIVHLRKGVWNPELGESA